MFTKCSIWSPSNISDVMVNDHFTEYSMTSEHHGDITVQTEAELSSYQMGIKLKIQNFKLTLGKSENRALKFRIFSEIRNSEN